MDWSRVAVMAAALGAWSGCERDPLDVACADVGAGALVITEIRTAPSGGDLFNSWIELYNAGGGAVDLAGLVVDMTEVVDAETDTPRFARILVRERGLSMAAGDYLVLGSAVPGQELPHMDYGYGLDFTGSLFPSAALALRACGGEVIDEVEYRGLPRGDALVLDGAAEPSAADNDLADASDPGSPWCLDAASDDIPGSPGEANIACN